MLTFKQFIREWYQNATSSEGPMYTGEKRVKWRAPGEKEHNEVGYQNQAAQQDHDHFPKKVRNGLAKLSDKKKFDKAVDKGKNKSFNWKKHISLNA